MTEYSFVILKWINETSVITQQYRVQPDCMLYCIVPLYPRGADLD